MSRTVWFVLATLVLGACEAADDDGTGPSAPSLTGTYHGSASGTFRTQAFTENITLTLDEGSLAGTGLYGGTLSPVAPGVGSMTIIARLEGSTLHLTLVGVVCGGSLAGTGQVANNAREISGSYSGNLTNLNHPSCTTGSVQATFRVTR